MKHWTASLSPLGCLHLRPLYRFQIESCLLLGRRPEHGLSCSWRVPPPADLMDKSLPHCEIWFKNYCHFEFTSENTEKKTTSMTRFRRYYHFIFQYAALTTAQNLNSLSPDGASGWRQWAHEVGDVVWNVDGQWGNLGLDGLDRWFRHVPWLLLVIGQGCERDLYTCAGEPETTPENKKQAQTKNFKMCVLGWYISSLICLYICLKLNTNKISGTHSAYYQ